MTQETPHGLSPEPTPPTDAPPPRKPWVEPRISPAIDVLEATTMFASVESGLPPGKPRHE